jgi:hypothetical protein
MDPRVPTRVASGTYQMMGLATGYGQATIPISRASSAIWSKKVDFSDPRQTNAMSSG